MILKHVPYPNIRISLANWTICILPHQSKKGFFHKFNAKKGNKLVLPLSTFGGY